LIWLGATAIVSGIVGILAYQAGWAAGLAAKLPAGTVVPYYYGPHFFGFGFFGPLFFLLVLFVVLVAVRGGGRRWRPWGGYPSAAPPAGDDPWRAWPQRPPAEQRPPEQRPPEQPAVQEQR